MLLRRRLSDFKFLTVTRFYGNFFSSKKNQQFSCTAGDACVFSAAQLYSCTVQEYTARTFTGLVWLYYLGFTLGKIDKIVCKH